MGRHLDRAHHLPARGIERVQPVAGGEPDLRTVMGDPVHGIGAGKWSILAEDLGGCSFHAVTLVAEHECGE